MFQFEAAEGRNGNAAMQIAQAFQSWSKTNANVPPGNFTFVTPDLAKKLTAPLDTFEMVNPNVLVDPKSPRVKGPQVVLAKERVARRVPSISPMAGLDIDEDDAKGGWEKAYIFCDGSFQHARTRDGNFTEWERLNTRSP